jgi:hypothetical protein
LVGQKLVEKLEQGIVSLEMGKTAEHIDSRTYLLQHGLLDALMLVVLLLAWLPIFLMGVWSRRRREKMISLPALLVDAGVHLVLPTALLLLWTRLVPVFLVRRFVPDVYYVVYAVIASLYLGAVVKLITGIAIALQNKWHEKKEGNKEKANEEESKESGEKEQKTNEEEGKNPKEKEDKKQEGDKTKKDKE